MNNLHIKEDITDFIRKDWDKISKFLPEKLVFLFIESKFELFQKLLLCNNTETEKQIIDKMFDIVFLSNKKLT